MSINLYLGSGRTLSKEMFLMGSSPSFVRRFTRVAFETNPRLNLYSEGKVVDSLSFYDAIGAGHVFGFRRSKLVVFRRSDLKRSHVFAIPIIRVNDGLAACPACTVAACNRMYKAMSRYFRHVGGKTLFWLNPTFREGGWLEFPFDFASLDELLAVPTLLEEADLDLDCGHDRQ